MFYNTFLVYLQLLVLLGRPADAVSFLKTLAPDFFEKMPSSDRAQSSSNKSEFQRNPPKPPKPGSSYLCRKCRLPGHWFMFCPAGELSHQSSAFSSHRASLLRYFHSLCLLITPPFCTYPSSIAIWTRFLNTGLPSYSYRNTPCAVLKVFL